MDPIIETKVPSPDVPFVNYVCCFVFDRECDHVLLLKKDHGPEALLGKWNGPGGKLKDGETFSQAATREFGEEVGLYVAPENWRYFMQLNGPGYQCNFLTAVFDEIENCIQMEDEEVRVHSIMDVLEQPNEAYCHNVPWLCLLAFDNTTEKVLANSIN